MSMRKISFLALLSVFLALPVMAEPSIYQPPTPVQKLVKTPGAPQSEMNGIATDEYLRPQVVIAGGGASTPAPTAAPAEITPVAQAVMQPTALPTLFPVTPNALSNSTALRALRINNQFNTDIQCTYGAAAATPQPFTVPAGTQNYENFAANGAKLSSGVSCIHPSSTPASGTLQVWGY